MFDLQSHKRLAALTVAVLIVLVGAAVIGGAPTLLGFDDQPTASITFDDQTGDGTAVTIDEVTLSDGGFVVLTNGGGDVIAVSSYLEPGEHDGVVITIAENTTSSRDLLGQLSATVHQDTTDDERYAYEETDGDEDVPYTDSGYPVSDTATVTMDTRDTTDSFVVESVDAPETATIDDEITVVAEIRNPADFERQGAVEFRLDGQVLERQILELGPDETREVTFEIDTSAGEPGTQVFGVYTEDDGRLDEITLEPNSDDDGGSDE